MSARLAGKIAVVVGAGQTPGATIGNGRAIALLFAREGASVVCVDRDLARAEETVRLIAAEGGSADAFAADITDPGAGAAIVAAALDRHGRIDILVNNVGAGPATVPGDGAIHEADDNALTRG
ncbi:SDR family NAD(P)-dependent oxidoreductase [uncultured Sphingomonas sp.]|uniref:SDR family NAD(P)-dependent oxidoreductase n=1 Tax=uncultured Sphingomonas sp. TaxID=158754 RepID=UPI0026155D93|nr:SDR family NAD(P)-dependent oxidoreductase [uncultured Sphingomonas sp.]